MPILSVRASKNSRILSGFMASTSASYDCHILERAAEAGQAVSQTRFSIRRFVLWQEAAVVRRHGVRRVLDCVARLLIGASLLENVSG